MIDIVREVPREKLITISRAATLVPVGALPGTASPRQVSKRTVYHWAGVGVGGARLRTKKIGGRIFATDDWLDSFFDECSTAHEHRIVMDQQTCKRRRAARRTSVAQQKSRQELADRYGV